MQARDGEGEGEDRERYGGPVLAAIRPWALGSLNGLTLVTGSRLSAICILSHATSIKLAQPLQRDRIKRCVLVLSSSLIFYLVRHSIASVDLIKIVAVLIINSSLIIMKYRPRD